MQEAQEGTPVTPGHIRHGVGECAPVRHVLDRVGDRWSVLLIVVLGEGPRRFNDLKRAAGGITQRMLTLTLRALERDGLVSRTVFPSVPPSVEYALTPLGESLRGPVTALLAWERDHRADIAAARERFPAGDAP
jgi:DNA-binding HxlR family transcriptional regulator